ncbi:hypothetical protein Pmani_037219 [Petrolisthes manimaculis]|uniref:FUN14 domain-containing protein 1 n=1 Tax=Petrolisthes manimaculis TaxID=1843537 RepID=A0AAE1NJL6_9EUCA|nr:hypothetical protein Pmani_037219 [Petrolisthes manimaculis]
MGQPRHTNTGESIDDDDHTAFEILDVRGAAKKAGAGMGGGGGTWLRGVFRDLTNEPFTKQVAVGGLSGWLVGYLSMKVGKVAATVVGGSMLMMQLAVHKGYIKVDWNRVNKDLERNARKLKQEVEANVGGVGITDEVIRYGRENIVLASSFGGGVLLGIASS